MLDLDQETLKKFQILFNNKPVIASFEINFLGDIKDQHPKVIMLYALCKTCSSDDDSTPEPVLEEVYSVKTGTTS